MSNAITVGRIGAHDIGTEVVLRHGDSTIRGTLLNIIHDVETIEERNVFGEHIVSVYTVTSTLDISGVIVYGVDPKAYIDTDPYGS